jgi:surfeit locus 1 family protein
LNKRLSLFIALAVVLAAICVRLGFWQLTRLEQRKARNALVSARLTGEPIDVGVLPRDTADANFRRVRVVGTPDYAHELIHTARSRRGSPGVNLLTPYRIPGNDTAILVNRGWVYSPSATTLDLAKWHDRDSVLVGYVVELPATGGAASPDRPNTIFLFRLSHDVVSQALPYPVRPVYVVAVSNEAGDTSTAVDRIARLPMPTLDNGNHFSYAVQWFGFATVALVGAVIVIRQSRATASGLRSRVAPASPGDASERG